MRVSRMVAGVLALGLLAGCYGPFNLTRKVWRWNGEVSENKWVVEAVFLACSIFPVYSAAGTLDVLLFNSIEFWTGSNPISADAAKPKQTRLAAGNAHAVVTRTGSGTQEQMLIEQFQDGQQAQSLRIQQQDGLTVAYDDSGKAVMNAQTLPDGSILVTDAAGQRVAFYTASQVSKAIETAQASKQ